MSSDQSDVKAIDYLDCNNGRYDAPTPGDEDDEVVGTSQAGAPQVQYRLGLKRIRTWLHKCEIQIEEQSGTYTNSFKYGWCKANQWLPKSDFWLYSTATTFNHHLFSS